MARSARRKVRRVARSEARDMVPKFGRRGSPP